MTPTPTPTHVFTPRSQLLENLNSTDSAEVLNLYIREATGLTRRTCFTAYTPLPVWQCVAILDDRLTTDELDRLVAFVHAHRLGVLSALAGDDNEWDWEVPRLAIQRLLGRPDADVDSTEEPARVLPRWERPEGIPGFRRPQDEAMDNAADVAERDARRVAEKNARMKSFAASRNRMLAAEDPQDRKCATVAEESEAGGDDWVGLGSTRTRL